MLDEIINQAELNELAFNYIIVYIYFYIVIFFLGMVWELNEPARVCK